MDSQFHFVFGGASIGANSTFTNGLPAVHRKQTGSWALRRVPLVPSCTRDDTSVPWSSAVPLKNRMWCGLERWSLNATAKVNAAIVTSE